MRYNEQRRNTLDKRRHTLHSIQNDISKFIPMKLMKSLLGENIFIYVLVALPYDLHHTNANTPSEEHGHGVNWMNHNRFYIESRIPKCRSNIRLVHSTKNPFTQHFDVDRKFPVGHYLLQYTISIRPKMHSKSTISCIWPRNIDHLQRFAHHTSRYWTRIYLPIVLFLIHLNILSDMHGFILTLQFDTMIKVIIHVLDMMLKTHPNSMKLI